MCSLAFAQEDTLWTRVLPGTGNGWDEVVAMASDAQGNVYAASQNKYDLPATGKCAVILVKYSPTGVRLWQRRYTGPGYAVPTAMSVYQGGSVCVVGKVGTPFFQTDMLIMKYSPDGDSEWVRFHDASGRNDFATSLTFDDSGSIYVGGMSYGLSGREGCALVKYRGDGEFCWVQYYNSSGNQKDQTMAVAFSPEGCIYAAGRSATTNLVVIRYERDGSLSWLRETQSDSWTKPVRLAVDASGSALIAATETWPQLGLVVMKYTPSGDTVWSRHIHNEFHRGAIAGVQADDFNNVILAGKCYDTSAYGTVALVVKYSPEGAELWRAGTYSQFVYDSLEALAVNSRAEVIVTGQRKGGFSSQNPYCLTRKYSSEGVELWTRFWIPPDSGGTSARASTLVGDDLCIGGFCQYECEFGGDTSAFLLRYDDTGGTRWRARFVGPGVCAGSGRDVTFDSEGNVIVCGWLDMSGENEDAVVAKYSPSGDLLWQRNLGTEPGSEDRFIKVAVDALGNVYATGYTDSVGTSNDYLTAKYDAAGVLQWVQRYDGPANGDDKPAGLALDRQGNVIVAGKSRGVGTSYDYATVKYSPSGQELWVRRYNGAADSTDYAVGVVADTGGAVIVLGETWETHRLQPALAIKYRADGMQLWTVSCTTFYQPVGPVLDGTGGICLGANMCRVAGFGAVKVASGGETLWERSVTFHDTSVNLVDVALDSTGRFVLAGYIDGPTGYDYLTIAFSPLGQELWRRFYDDSAHNHDMLRAVSADGSGAVFVSGGVTSTNGSVSLAYDSTGRQVWYGQCVVPDGPDYFASARPWANAMSRAGLLAIAGYVWHGDLRTSMWNGVADFHTVLHAPQLALSEQPASTLFCLPALSINASPSPAFLPLHFQVMRSGQGRLTLRIYDLAGRLVRTLVDRADSRTSGKCEWDGRDDQGRSVSSGVYLAVAALERDGPAGRRPTLRATRKVVVR
jgi:uncharacterized delta-60 repeat protein